MNSIHVVVFAFNRATQLKKTLSQLKKNQVPLLYVFVDGPRNDRTNEDKQNIARVV